MRIVEELDATPKEAAITEVNSGTYCFEVALLVDAVRKLSPKNAKKELYLTDALEHIRTGGGRVSAYLTATGEEGQGVNNRLQLSNAERILNRRMLERLMLSGVTVLDPNTTYADADVEVGQDSVLLPGTILRGKTKVGRLCRIGPWTRIEDSVIGNECEVVCSYVKETRLLEKTNVGPFAHLRPGTTAGPRARIGNFTEGQELPYGSKVHTLLHRRRRHRRDVNVGAGTITCNYDGKDKHKTVGAKSRPNVNLIAPVKGRARLSVRLHHHRGRPRRDGGVARKTGQQGEEMKTMALPRHRPTAVKPQAPKAQPAKAAPLPRPVDASLRLFTGNANRPIAEKVAAYLGTSLSGSEVGRFADGEINVAIKENVRGKDCYVVQPTCRPTNENLMELLIMIDALRRASAGRITAVMPYFGYARADRKSAPCPSPRAWWPTSSPRPAPTASSRWTCTPARSRASSTSPWTTSSRCRCSSSTCAPST